MSISDHEQWMLHAIDEAKKAKEAGDFPFGAVIVHNGNSIAKGKAENNTTGDVTDHAEMIALRNACKILGTNDLSGCTIYSTNEPCDMCAGAIFQAKISFVKIGLSRDDLPHLLRPRNIRIRDLAHDSGYAIDIQTGILREQILKLFADVKKK